MKGKTSYSIKEEADGTTELVNSVLFSKDDTTVEDVFEQYYNFEKLSKWLNFKPIIWEKSDYKLSEVGHSAEFHVFFSKIIFKAECQRVLPNKRGIEVKISGAFNGTGLYEFLETDEGILHRHVMRVKGMSGEMDKKCHVTVVKWRFNKLAKMLEKESKKSKEE